MVESEYFESKTIISLKISLPFRRSWAGGSGVASYVWSSVRISFLEQISETHGGDFFHIAYKHPLGGVELPSGDF